MNRRSIGAAAAGLSVGVCGNAKWLVALFRRSFLLAPAVSRCEDRFMDVAGVKIRYVKRVLGEPLVLLHGGGAAASVDDWLKYGIFQDLAKTYRVIASEASLAALAPPSVTAVHCSKTT